MRSKGDGIDLLQKIMLDILHNLAKVMCTSFKKVCKKVSCYCCAHVSKGCVIVSLICVQLL